MTHLERLTVDGKWIEVEGTKHNHDPKSKSKTGKLAHGMMIDLEGQTKEVEDSAGKTCFESKPRWRRTQNFEEKKGMIVTN